MRGLWKMEGTSGGPWTSIAWVDDRGQLVTVTGTSAPYFGKREYLREVEARAVFCPFKTQNKTP